MIGADGSLTGYAGGLERKRLLLELEAPASQLGFGVSASTLRGRKTKLWNVLPVPR